MGNWIRFNRAKYALWWVAIVANGLMLGILLDAKRNWIDQPVSWGFVGGCGTLLVIWLNWMAQAEQNYRTRKPSPASLKNILHVLVAIAILAQNTNAADAPRRPGTDRPPLNRENIPLAYGVNPQTLLTACIGIACIGAGSYLTFWAYKKCSRWFAPTNGFQDHRFDDTGDGSGDYYDIATNDACYAGTCPRPAGMDDYPETIVQLNVMVQKNGVPRFVGKRILNPERALSFGQLNEDFEALYGFRFLGAGRGQQQFLHNGEPIAYGQSRIFFDYDATVVVLDKDWLVPQDRLTLERALDANGPWEQLVSVRAERGTGMLFNDSEGEKCFYRLSVETDQ